LPDIISIDLALGSKRYSKWWGCFHAFSRPIGFSKYTTKQSWETPSSSPSASSSPPPPHPSPYFSSSSGTTTSIL
jgi:hypothetical protein